MLSMPTLWLVFVVNFTALTLVWAYVLRSYPNFEAARYWTASAAVAALGAATALLRGVIETPLPLVVGGGLMVAACCLGSMGIDRFYGRRAAWRFSITVTTVSVASFAFFSYVYDFMAMRIVTYSICQSIPLAVSMRLLLSRHDGRSHPGARMTAVISALMLAVLTIRSVAALVGVGGELTPMHFNQFQAGMVVVLVFLSMMWCFGFLLMAIDRLRSEVAKLAMLDDLTGVANRRLLLQRLSEQCVLSQRTGEPFAMLAIDLDGFKAVNDSFGHGAGDECLRAFSRVAQGRLRPGDLLARVGGDEFCVLMPSTTLREGAMIARCGDGGLPHGGRGCDALDLGLDRRGALDRTGRRRSGPADRRRRPGALYRQEGRQEPLRGVRSEARRAGNSRSGAGAGADATAPDGVSRFGPRFEKR